MVGSMHDRLVHLATPEWMSRNAPQLRTESQAYDGNEYGISLHFVLHLCNHSMMPCSEARLFRVGPAGHYITLGVDCRSLSLKRALM